MALASARRAGSPRWGKAWTGYLAIGSVLATGYFAIPATGIGTAARILAYCLVSASAATAVVLGIAGNRPAHRLPWSFLAASQAVYAAADAIFYIGHYLRGSITFPSTADAFYLGHYPLVVITLILLIRRRTPGGDLPALVDAAALAVVGGLLSWLLLIAPQVDFSRDPVARFGSIGYPVMDLATFVVALRLIIGPGRRSPSFFLLSAALLAMLTADMGYGLQQLTGTYQPGTAVDLGRELLRLAGNLALGAAALHPSMARLSEPAGDPDEHPGPVRVTALALASMIAPLLLVVSYARHAYRDIPAIAGACVLLFGLAVVRMAGLAVGQRRLAITDGLTGLHSRRFVQAHLAVELARARRTGGRVALFIVDVDLFKSINDRFGHPGGDRALVEIAQRLRECTRPGDVLARYGGEEFALVVAGVAGEELAGIGERMRIQVESGPIAVSPEAAVPVTVSVGAASYPVSGEQPDELFAAADRALYLAKTAGRNMIVVEEADEQITLVAGREAAMAHYLQRIANHVDRVLSAQEHSTAISRWAVQMAQQLGYDEMAAQRVGLAGRLHDIGKIVIPDTVLTKRAALTPDEWQMLREHPDHGARLARLIRGLGTVADIIRQHHERYDGTGYPDRLAGTDIRPEARLISVCDCWAAMRSDRSYQAALPEDRAREELHRGRGSQFDPTMVDLFLDLHERGLIGLWLPRQPQPSQSRSTVPSPAT
jgi:two-component system, cell cycle response regulator